MLAVGHRFPLYKTDACIGIAAGQFVKISNTAFAGRWACYFFYPKDFESPCPPELIELGQRIKDFKDRDCEVLAGSTDNEFSHQAWRRSHPHLKELPYPMLNASRLAFDLGIVDGNACQRVAFLVDPHGVVQWAGGTNVVAVLRAIDALQSDELCPCNRKA